MPLLASLPVIPVLSSAQSVLAVSWPSFLTPDRLRWIIPLLLIAWFVAAFWFARLITKLAIRAAFIVVVALFGLTLWMQRSNLADCAKTCECSLYGIDVSIESEKVVEYGCGRNS